MDVHNVEDAGLSPAEAQAMHDAWAVNTAAVGESVLKRGGFAVPYFAAMQRNVTDPVTHCQRDMQTVCKGNKTTGRPNIHDQALLLEFSESTHPSFHFRGKAPGWRAVIVGVRHGVYLFLTEIINRLAVEVVAVRVGSLVTGISF